MAEEFDINEEYEKIFGVEARESLFSADDEEYNALRQEILDAKREFDFKKHLPFEGIKLSSYEDFLRSESVHVAENSGFRIFYIRRYNGEKLVCYAAGYFNAKDSRFVVLKGAFFDRSDYYTSLVSHIAPYARMRFSTNYEYKDGVLTQKDRWSFESASLAASYILGRKSSFREWRDDRGKTLDAYYAKYKSASVDETEDKTFPDYVAPAPPPPPSSIPEPSSSNIRVNRITESVNTASTYSFASTEHHLFKINIPGTCNATGYHDEEANRFVVLKGSSFSKKVESGFEEKPLYASRQRFIEAVCVDKGSMYEVSKDTKCKSASAAASYLLGKEASYTLWKDSNGKFLKDFFPTRYVMSGEMASNKVNILDSLQKYAAKQQVFYIKKDNEPGRFCEASGTYDSTTQKFILKAGSILSEDAATSYNYSAKGIHRRNFLNKFCSKFPKGYRLRNDYTFDSPSAAASYVIGRDANGWQEWRTESGTTLDEVFRQ